MERTQLGKRSEDLAVEYLRKAGLKIVQRNYRCKLGEIDCVARDGNSIVFVEVRSRSTADSESPKYSIGPKKRRTISKVALYYLKRKGLTSNSARFDVVTVVFEGDAPTIEWTRNAFDCALG